MLSKPIGTLCQASQLARGAPPDIVPEINLNTLPFIATVVLLFAGMEMAGFHALEVRNQVRFSRSA